MTTDVQFSPDADRFAPWSFSKAKMAMACPYKFGQKYLLKTRLPPEEISEELIIGTTVHKVLEFIALGMEPTVALETALVSVPQERNQRALTHNEIDAVRAYSDNFENYAERFSAFVTKHGVAKRDTRVEGRFAATRNFTPTSFFGKDVFFRGVYDKYLITRGRHAVVIDHKRRGYPKPEAYEDQLKCYAVMVNMMNPTLKSVTGAIHFLEDEHIMWGQPYTAEQIKTTLVPWFVRWINKAAECATRSSIVVRHHCTYCGYKDNQCIPERKRRRSAFRKGKLEVLDVFTAKDEYTIGDI